MTTSSRDALRSDAALAQPRAVTVQTVPFATRNGKELLADLYLPQSASATPAIIFLHGGGWFAGSRSGGPGFTKYFAQDGFAMVSIDYRLVPDIRFPANVEDVKTAVRWLRANARKYNIDPDRIALWGTSAGGHLGAVAGLSTAGVFEGEDNLDQSSTVRCVFDGYGPSAISIMNAQLNAEKAKLQKIHPAMPPWRGAEGMEARAESPEEGLIGAKPEAAPEKARAADPATYVTNKAPPFMIMHGLADGIVPHGQSVLLYEALAKAGNDATLLLIDGLGHGYYNVSDLDERAGPFRMDFRRTQNGQQTSGELKDAKVFDLMRGFFRAHLM